MKKTFFLILTAVLAFACSKNEDAPVLPKITFADALYSVPKGCSQTVRILLDEPVKADTPLKLTFAGTAVKGTDYTVDNETVTILSGEKEAKVVVTVPYAITASKSIEISIPAPITGYELGRFFKVTVNTTLDVTTIFSFAKPSVDIQGDIIELEAELIDQQGKAFTVSEATAVNIAVNSASTAVYGVHYKFENDQKIASFAKGKNIGKFKIEVLKYEEGKNKIVLECGDKNGYFPGAVPEIVITIPQRMSDRIVGEWKGLDYYKLSEFVQSWGFDEQQKAAIPTCTSSDVISFKADKSFTISSTGKLKNYFRSCTWSVEGNDLIHLGTSYPPEKYYAPRCKMSKVNYLFTEASEEIKEAKINVLITSSPEHSEVLILQINQYNNTTDLSFVWNDPLTFRFVRK